MSKPSPTLSGRRRRRGAAPGDQRHHGITGGHRRLGPLDGVLDHHPAVLGEERDVRLGRCPACHETSDDRAAHRRHRRRAHDRNLQNRFQSASGVARLRSVGSPRMCAAIRRDGGGDAQATISDVARLAGVSAATVSRVFNNTSSVSPDKAERVRRAVAQLDYQPFGPAQALRRQQVRVWAIVIADVENPFFTSVVRGIEDIAYTHGYRLVLCNSDEDVAKEAGYIDIVIRERMSGVVIAVASTSDSHLDRLTREGIPVVAIDRRADDGGIDTVLVDNVSGGRDATAHLLEMGYRRVGCVLGPSRLSTSNERLDGYRAALKDAGVRFDRSLVRRADFREDGGYKATRALLEA